MYKIKRIKITGFRRLLELDLPVRPFMVLIGANGVGKTSFLDAFSLLSASASGNLNGKLSQFGGVANLLTSGRSEDLSFLVDMDVSGYQPLEYEVHLETKAFWYTITRERLSQKRDGNEGSFSHIDSSGDDIRYYETEERRLVDPNWEHNPLETSLAQVPTCPPL
jgi:predicted ATPase